ncbi:MAG: PQQ-binding-like beta-propeller repeat protein [Gammaproteobacteria bacterium]|nr:PQQ-binding-like beta-propeller repeat protein [Gammaproteobacteria bacterium]
MKIRTIKPAWTVLGSAVSLLIGSAAIADDTELLLRAPDPTTAPKANVMFILDTSGSMTSVEMTAEPYDSTQTYAGSCDTNNYYWTDVDIVPVCDGTETQFFQKSAFYCDYASLQIAGIGSFTNTMAQYRVGTSGDISWQYLEPGDDSSAVECQADIGTHGDGTAGEVYPVSASGLPNGWTADPNGSLSWGSAPRNLAYTVYDGNYLNWSENPVMVMMSRSDIMKEVTKKVLSSVNNLNVGMMRFNDNEGGPVILGMTDLETNRAAVLAAIDSLPASGATPLAETLYENALYWLGDDAHYGQLINETPTDPNALDTTTPENYKQPALEACAKNYNVLLSDGQPNNNEDAPGLTASLPDYATVMGRSNCTGSADGDCLDDISEYLSLVDTDPVNSGTQGVTTHTIGFTINLPILADTAANSGGEYFLADDVESLTITLLQILADINSRALSFSAPAVSVNAFNRTQNLNDLYLTMFAARSQTHWPGNLKKYKIINQVISDQNGVTAVDPTTGFFYDTAHSYWSASADGSDVEAGGAANNLPDPSVRNLYTNNGGGSSLAAAANLLTPSNAGSFTQADFGLTGATGEPTVAEIIRWMRGEDIRDEDNNAATTVRNVMGDPLHSQPASIVYGGSSTNPDVVIYTATNDGYLHAINGATGAELWSFVPKELLNNQARLYFNSASSFKQYGIDGNVVPVVADRDGNGVIDGSDFVYLVFGMRRGGDTYYALDVTNKNAPQLMWTFNSAHMGQSWSTPVITRVDVPGVNADKAVVVIGGGYDAVHDTAAHPSTADGSGAGIHMLDLESGTELWRAGPDASADLQLAGLTRAIASRVTVIDMSGDGLADRMYAADMGGQILRFDIFNGSAAGSLVTGGVIAQLGAEGIAAPGFVDTRRFYTSPDVSLFNDDIQDRRFLGISIGSGYRAHPFDLSAADRFFSLRDKNVFNQLSQADYDAIVPATESTMVEVSGQTQVVITENDDGWRFTLPNNQKVLANSITFDNEVFFVAFSPDSANTGACSAGNGTNFLYRMSVINGDPIVNNLDTLDPALSDEERMDTLAQGGIAPSPTILFPSPDDPDCEGDACSPPPIGCVGVECFDPGFVNNPVRTLWTQDGIE